MVDTHQARSRGKLAEALKVRGLMNVQWAVRKNPDSGEDELFVIEVNPRASRTVPFVGKATGVAWANLAAKVMAGQAAHRAGRDRRGRARRIRRSRNPCSRSRKFPGVDVILGPGDAQHGRVHGRRPATSRWRSRSRQMAAGVEAADRKATVFLSVRAEDKADGRVGIARKLTERWVSSVADHRPARTTALARAAASQSRG